jgi:hypothetical protein
MRLRAGGRAGWGAHGQGPPRRWSGPHPAGMPHRTEGGGPPSGAGAVWGVGSHRGRARRAGAAPGAGPVGGAARAGERGGEGGEEGGEGGGLPRARRMTTTVAPVIQARVGREWERGGRGRGVVSLFLDHGCAGEGSGAVWARMGGRVVGPCAIGRAGPCAGLGWAWAASPLIDLVTF